MRQGLTRLPYELLVNIFAYLNINDLLSVLSCHPQFYYHFLQQDSPLWFDICRVNRVNYHHPDCTYKDIVYSDEVQKMCPHVSQASKMLAKSTVIHEKQNFIWTTLGRYFNQGPADGRRDQGTDCRLCLYPSCSHSDLSTSSACTGNKEHEHPIMLRTSNMYPLEIWCSSCSKTIGFYGFNTKVKDGLASERYIMAQLLHAILHPQTAKNDENLCALIKDTRRAMEIDLYHYQSRYSTMHVIDRQWYIAWIVFLSGESNELPGVLTNKKLFRADGSLDPKLSLGKDFELISSLLRWYIEHTYGVMDKVITYTELPNNAEYCKLLHGIQIDQMNHITRYPNIHRP